MSVKVIVSFTVSDFDEWKFQFDAGESVRSAADIHMEAHRNVDDPNNAWAIGTAPSKEAFLSVLLSPEAQERIKQAGVTAPPNVNFLEPA